MFALAVVESVGSRSCRSRVLYKYGVHSCSLTLDRDLAVVECSISMVSTLAH